MRFNHPVILMVDGKVREVGRIDIGPDWKFEGWISTSIADALDLQKNLGSLALNPVDDYIATDTTGAIVEPSEEYFDDNTMEKVVEALTDNGCTVNEAQALINSMKHAGILFRERRVEAPVEYCELQESVDHTYDMWCVTHNELAKHCGPDGDSRVCSKFVAEHGCNCCPKTERKD